MLNKEIAAYLAGIIDGEGCIGINRNHNHTQRHRTPRYSIDVVVTNTSADLMLKLQEWFPASLRLRRKEREYWRECWRWVISGGKARKLLEFVLPYLIVKQKQAELALLYLDSVTPYNNRGHKAMPAEEWQKRERFYQWMKQLNSVPAETECEGIREDEATVRTVGKLTELAEMTNRLREVS